MVAGFCDFGTYKPVLLCGVAWAAGGIKVRQTAGCIGGEADRGSLG